MKKLIYFLMAIVFVVSSCDDEDQFPKYDLGTEFFVSDGGITSLDNEVTISITNDPQNLSSVKVFLGDNSVADIAISAGVGSTTISSATLGISVTGDAADLVFESSFDGKSIVRYHSVEVESPFSVKEPDLMHTDSAFAFLFDVSPVSAAFTNVVETKLFYDGDYSPATIVEGAEDEMDSVFINGLDYNIGDTVYVRVAAAAGSKADTVETYMVVAPYSFENVDVFTLDTTANLAFNLNAAEYVDASVAGDTADVEFTASYPISGPVEVGFRSNNNAEFVLATDKDYELADIENIRNTDFSGATQVVSKAQVRDVYIYRTRRGTNPWVYGIMKVIAVDKPQGVLEDSSITIEYKH